MKINSVNSFKNASFGQIQNVKSYINKEEMLDHFIKIAKIDSGSDRTQIGKKCPTTQGQLILAEELAKDLKEIGMEDVKIDENGFVTATLTANVENAPKIAFIAHMDTCSDANTSNVNPIVHDYESGDIKLKDNQTISEKELEEYKGHKIITSDGTSLLGADDKAGISEIIEALRVFKNHPELKHPTIKIAFTPDEEGADGIENFDIKKFNADVAYTIDGTDPSCIDTETFNAFNPIITIKGVDAHPGYAYEKMVSSIDLMNEFINQIPKDERPATTKDKEGYYHVMNITGSDSETKVKMLVRDFDYENAKKRVQFLRSNLEKLKEKYPEMEYAMEPNEMYQNMKNYMSNDPKIIENAKLAIQKTGLNPKETAIRGGTDGTTLTLNGLPCPNLGAGGVNFHTHREFISLETMADCCENIINLAQVWAK